MAKNIFKVPTVKAFMKKAENNCNDFFILNHLFESSDGIHHRFDNKVKSALVTSSVLTIFLEFSDCILHRLDNIVKAPLINIALLAFIL